MGDAVTEQPQDMTPRPKKQGHDDRPRCGAKKRDGSGGTCTQHAGWGTDHPGVGPCKLHGGNTRNHKTAAQTELARRAVHTYGLPRNIAPDAALLEEVHRTAGHVAWLATKVAELDEDDLVWNRVEEVDKQSGQFGGVDTTHKATPHTWVTLYQAERKHLVAVSKAALDAGIAERQVRLAEQQGVVLAEVVRRIADGLLASLVELLGQQAGADRAVVEAVRAAWPGWLGEIAPREIRAAAAQD